MNAFISSTLRVGVASILLLSQLASSIPYIGRGNIAEANWSHDNTSGNVTIDFLNNQAGISGGTNYEHQGIAPGTVTSAGGPASITTSSVSAASIDHRDDLVVTHSGGDIEYQILECDNTPITTQLPYAGPVDLNQTTFAAYECIRTQLYRSDPVVIDDIEFNWTPLPETDIVMTPNTTEISAGSCENYSISRSHSYYDDENTVIYTQLPYYDPADPSASVGFDLATIDDLYGQFPYSNLLVGSIADNGQRNDSDQSLTLVSGLEVPAHSVYRELSGQLGSSNLYSFTLCSDVGTQNGVMFDMSSTVLGSSSYTNQSNTVQTQITSTAQSFHTCTADSYNIITNSDDKIVEYAFSSRSLLLEDVFNPVFDIDYTETVTFLQSCGLSESDSVSRITIPDGFTSIAVGNTVSQYTIPTLYSENNDLYGDQFPEVINYITTVDYDGCAVEGMTTLFGSLTADNAADATGACEINFQTVCGDGDIQTPNSTGQNEECDEGDANSDTGTCSTGCLSTFCGDSNIQSPNANGEIETCDDDTENADDKACSSICELTFCGDGIIQILNGAGEEEQCDGGVECDTSCQWIPVCGNLRVEDGEECDNGISNADNAECSSQCLATGCGDGVVQSPNGGGVGEECDDGNDIDADECSNTCVLPGNGGNTDTTDGFTNKCMFTTTSHEEGGLDFEGIAAQEGYDFFDSECLDLSGDLIVNTQRPGETFYHLNYRGQGEQIMRQGLYSLDRVPQYYAIQNVDIWTNETSNRMLENDSSWAEVFCHEDTGMTAPAYDASLLDGNTTPDATSLGVGRSTTCDVDSRRVLSSMKCLNDTNAFPSAGSACENAPTRYQFRIYVEPLTSSLICSGKVPQDRFVPNTADVYVSSSGTVYPLIPNVSTDPVISVSQSSIIKAPASAQIVSGDIKHLLSTNSDIAANQEKLWTYQRENSSDIPVTGDISIQFDDLDGVCPSVEGDFPTGYMYDDQTCVLAGPVSDIGASEAVISCEDAGIRVEVMYDQQGREIFRADYIRDGSMWRGTTKIERAYDEEGGVILIAGYSWDTINGERIGISKSESSYEYRFDGDSLKSDLIFSKSYVRDSTISDWVNDSRTESVYNDRVVNGNHQLTYFLLSNRENNQWMQVVEDIYVYDNLGRIDSISQKNRDVSTGEQISGENEYMTYENGDLINFISYIYDTTQGVYIPSETTEYIYDEYGYLLSQTNQSARNQTTNTRDFEQVEFLNDIVYTTTGVPNLGTGFRYGWDGSSLVIDAYIQVEISDEGGLRHVDEFTYAGLDDTLPEGWIRKTYKDGDLEVYITEGYTRNQSENRRIGSNKIIRENSSVGNIELNEIYIRNDSLQDWMGFQKTVREYYDINNLLLLENYFWDASIGDWRFSLGTEYIYDIDGLLVSDIRKTIDNINSEKTDYERENGKIISRTNYVWNPSTNMRDGVSRTTSIYSTSGELLEEKDDQYVSGEWILSSGIRYVYNNEGNISYRELLNSTGTILRQEREYDNQGGVISYMRFGNTATGFGLLEHVDYVVTAQGISVGKVETCKSLEGGGLQRVILAMNVTYPAGAETILTTTASYDLDYCDIADVQSADTNYQGVDPSVPTDFTPGSYALPTITPPDLITVPDLPVYTLPEPLPTSLLITEKYLDTDLIEEDGMINYTLQILNSGEKTEYGVYMIDPLPEGTELVSVKTSGAIIPNMIDSSGSQVTPVNTQYDCVNNGIGACEVLFAETVVPEKPTVPVPYDQSTIDTYFTDMGTEMNGEWIPTGIAPSDANYTAIHIPSLEVGQYALIQIQVKNTENVRGDIIVNSVSTISDSLLQSISNTVYTTLLPTIPNTIDGVVYEDSNRSGFLDGGEVLFAGVPVFLTNELGNIITQTVTNENGIYFFESLPDGEYTVSYDSSVLENHNSISSNPGSIDDVIVGTATADLLTIQEIIIADGVNSVGNNFGLIADLVSIGGTVYFDDENDDSYTDDQGLQDMIVLLYDENGDVVGTQSTDENGSYFFTELLYGTYSVAYTNSSNYTPDSLMVGSIDGVTTGIVDGIQSVVDIVLEAGDISIENDFGLIDPALSTLQGSIYFDDENDDIYVGDQGLDGYTVSQLDNNGNLIETTVTDTIGSYEFVGLVGGSYIVVYDDASSVYPYSSDSNIPGPATLDGSAGSGINATTIENIVIGIDEQSVENDFGLIDPGTNSLSGTIYFDDEDDDVYDADQGLDGYVVTLLDNDGEIVSTTTNEFGDYEFTNLLVGVYTVSYDPENINYTYTPDSVIPGNQAESTSIMLIQVTLENPGELSENNDFGLIEIVIPPVSNPPVNTGGGSYPTPVPIPPVPDPYPPVEPDPEFVEKIIIKKMEIKKQELLEHTSAEPVPLALPAPVMPEILPATGV